MATDTVETILDATTARAILAEVAEGGWLDHDLPEQEDILIDMALEYANEARKWVEDGNPADRHINAIIGLATVTGKTSPPVLSETAENTNDGVPPGEITYESDKLGGFAPAQVADEVAKTYPRRSSGGYSEEDLRTDEGLPLPSPIPEDSLDMPSDLPELGDKQLRRLYSAFNSYLSRANWRLATSKISLASAVHLQNDIFRRRYKFYSQELIKNGERATKDMVENFSKDDEEYKEWEEKVLTHEQEVIHWKALSDIYSKNVEVISREWTMRTDQYERER